MTNRSVVAAALKLPLQEKLRLLKKLQRNVADEKVLIAGALKESGAAAQLASTRIKACRSGKMKTVEEEEIMDLLRTKSSS